MSCCLITITFRKFEQKCIIVKSISIACLFTLICKDKTSIKNNEFQNTNTKYSKNNKPI